MAAKYLNGPALCTLERNIVTSESRDAEGARQAEGYTVVMSVHANGHILEKRGRWRQWAIVPIDGIGSVVDYLIGQGWTIR